MERLYLFRITPSDGVDVMSDPDTLALRLEPDAYERRRLWRASSDSIATAASPLSIRRTRRFPVPQFVISREMEQRATVQCVHPLRIRYRISPAKGVTWLFQMPLFRARFSGSSSAAGSLKVRVIRENLWDALLDADDDSAELLAAIACIQLARWQSI